MTYLVRYHCTCGQWHVVMQFIPPAFEGPFLLPDRKTARALALELLSHGKPLATSVHGPWQGGERIAENAREVDRYERTQRGEVIHVEHGRTPPRGLEFLEELAL